MLLRRKFESKEKTEVLNLMKTAADMEDSSSSLTSCCKCSKMKVLCKRIDVESLKKLYELKMLLTNYIIKKQSARCISQNHSTVNQIQPQ